MVHHVGLFVAHLPLPDLLFKPLPLDVGVVQLGVGVADLFSADEQLEPLHRLGVVLPGLGEGGDVQGVIRQEGRLDEGRLHRRFQNFVQHLAEAVVAGDVDSPLLGPRAGGCLPGQVVRRHTGDFRQGLPQLHSPPGRRQVHVLAVPGGLPGAEDVVGHFHQERLDQVHHVPVVGVRHIPLQHRELGVVLGGDALVSEVAVDLIDPVDSADDQALEVELGRDPQIEGHFEGVMMRHEGPGGRTPDDGLHHRGLDLEKSPGVEPVAKGLDDPGAHREGLAHLRVHQQVHVPLAVAGLHVLEAVPLLGQGPEGLGEKRQLVRREGELSPLRLHDLAPDADEIADVQALEEFIRRLAEAVLLGDDLNLARSVPDVAEGQLSQPPLGHHAAGQDVGLGPGFQFFARQRAVFLNDAAKGRRRGKAVDVGVSSLSP